MFNAFLLRFADQNQEKAYRRTRGKWSVGVVGFLAVVAIGVLLTQNTWAAVQAGCVVLPTLLTLKSNPRLSLLLFTYLHYLVLLQFKDTPLVTVLFATLQVIPGEHCYGGMVVERVVGTLGTVYFLLSPDWSPSTPWSPVSCPASSCTTSTPSSACVSSTKTSPTPTKASTKLSFPVCPPP